MLTWLAHAVMLALAHAVMLELASLVRTRPQDGLSVWTYLDEKNSPSANSSVNVYGPTDELPIQTNLAISLSV